MNDHQKKVRGKFDTPLLQKSLKFRKRPSPCTSRPGHLVKLLKERIRRKYYENKVSSLSRQERRTKDFRNALDGIRNKVFGSD